MDSRWHKVLRRMRDLGGWLYADEISLHGDGRTAGAVLVALHRAGLVTWAEGKRRSTHSSTLVWTLTADGLTAAR
jgi:hypothetical protein